MNAPWSVRRVISLGPGFAAGVALLLCGCTTVGVHEQRLVSKPNMEFSRSMIHSYDARVLSQVQPGRDVTSGAQASSCTLCR